MNSYSTMNSLTDKKLIGPPIYKGLVSNDEPQDDRY
jgi:hypothetical protein